MLHITYIVEFTHQKYYLKWWYVIGILCRILTLRETPQHQPKMIVFFSYPPFQRIHELFMNIPFYQGITSTSTITSTRNTWFTVSCECCCCLTSEERGEGRQTGVDISSSLSSCQHIVLTSYRVFRSIFRVTPKFRLVHSHWSGTVEALLWLVDVADVSSLMP